ncbi:MAG: NUDIX domain-containing protein [Desulfitobacteriia bacterium]
MNFKETCLTQEVIFKGKIIEVYKDTVLLPNGKETTREIVHHPGAVGIIALFEEEVLMVKQYRYALHKETLEIPAGKIDPGEEPEKCAVRELREETGYEGKMQLLGVFNTSPGFADEIIYLYLATQLKWSPLTADEDEFLGVIRVPWKEAVRMAFSNQIQDAKSVLGILLTQGVLK